MSHKFIVMLFSLTIIFVSSSVSAVLADEIYDFHVAVERCDADKIKAFLSKNPKLIESKVGHGFRPLHKAAMTGRKDIVELLLSRGANINAIDNMGLTPLHWAISEGSFDVVKLFVDKGANLNIKTYSGISILKYAITSRVNNEIADYLRKKGAKE